MTDLGTQIRDYIEVTAAPVEVEELAIDRVRLAKSRPPRPRNGLVAAFGAAVLILVAIGGVMLAVGLAGDGDRVATEPPPTVVPTTAIAPIVPDPGPSPEPTTSALERPAVVGIPAPTGVVWEKLPDDEEPFLGNYFYGVTVGGPGLVAVGAECDTILGDEGNKWFIYDEPFDFSATDNAEPGCHWYQTSPPPSDAEDGFWSAAVWTSTDGITWERVPRDEEIFGGPGDQVMVDVIAGGPGLVAVGEENASWVGSTVAVWTSVDGLTWQKVEDQNGAFAGTARIEAITTHGPDLVAVGVVDNTAAAWTSADGFVWERATVDDSQDVGTTMMHDVVVGGPGLVAVGVDYAAERPLTAGMSLIEGAVWRAAVWTSVDGTVWTRVPHADQTFGGYPNERIDPTTVIDGMMSMWSVAAVDDGLVAAGWSALERAAWFSPDGLDWVRIDEHDDTWAGIGLGGNGPTEAIVADGSRFTGVGWDPRAGYFQERRQWRHDPAGPWGDAMTDAVVFGDRLIAVGYVDYHSRGAIWFGTWSE